VILYCQDDFFHWHIEASCHRLDNADIRLMRYQPIKFIFADARILKSLGSDVSECPDRDLKNLVTAHYYSGIGRSRGGEIVGRPHRVVQQVLVLPVGTKMTGNNSRLFGRFQYDSARTIAEQYAGISIIPVDKFGDAFCAHDQSAFRSSLC